MANTVYAISYANTFGDWVVTTDNLVTEVNSIGKGNWTKDSGLLTLAGSGTALQVANDALIQGNLTVSGTATIAIANISTLNANVPNTRIVGLITSGQIANVTNTQITGLITSSQIANIANTQIVGNIVATSVANTGIVGLITSGQINTVTASQITGLIASSQIANVANTQIVGNITATSVANTGIVGLITSGQINTVTASQITGTITNRVNPRTNLVTTNPSSITPDLGSYDVYAISSQAQALTFNAPIGTLVSGNKLLIRVSDNGTGQSLTWNVAYTPIGVTLPTTTVANKTTYVGCIYNGLTTNWDVVAVATQS